MLTTLKEAADSYQIGVDVINRLEFIKELSHYHWPVQSHIPDQHYLLVVVSQYSE